ncbi:MAG: hypothetical protein LQ342_005950 [Letrouitia transgressa]|nr:MAG: hypothetical protein LQ342_005950 [Letrouitia transgressa]
MPDARFGAGDLLEYNSKYSLLICRKCQYAVQKNALESHLLRHKIYRGDRQRLLSSIARLDLLEPHHVPLPAPGSPPVDALPILSGYCCTAEGCLHLTASSKRIKRHWSEFHGLHGLVPLSSSFARPAKLQTFFRGTKVRYFEVASPTTSLSNTDYDGNDDDGKKAREEEGRNAIAATPPSRPSVPVTPGTAQDPSPADFNLETLAYFYHFSTTTSLTLPGAEHPQSAKHYWQTHVLLRALQQRWLMCGLLAISAYHLVALADDTTSKQIHRERGVHFYSEFSAGLGQTTGSVLDLEVANIVEETKQCCEQIRRLLYCAQWLLAEDAFGDAVARCQLLPIMSTVRGCGVPNYTLRHSKIRNENHESQEEWVAQGCLHTRNSSHSENPNADSSNTNMPSVLLNILRALPFRIAEGLGRPESAQDVFATLSAISTMVECCDISFACDEVAAAWQGVATWLTNVPDHYNQMVQRHDPAALVVLAHWAAMLVKRAERVGCWFLKGSAKIIVLQVARHLSAKEHTVLSLVECLMVIVDN